MFGMLISAGAVDEKGTIALLSPFDGAGGVIRPAAFGTRAQALKPMSSGLAACPGGGFVSLRSGKEVIKIAPDGSIKPCCTIVSPEERFVLPNLFFSEGGDTLVIVDVKGVTLGVDLSTGEVRWRTVLEKYGQWLRAGPRAASLSGERIVGCDGAGTVRIWNKDGKVEQTLLNQFPPVSLSASPTDDQITLVGPAGEISSLTVRTDPRVSKHYVTKSTWHFPYFPRGALRGQIAKWRTSWIRRFVAGVTLAILDSCIWPPSRDRGFGLVLFSAFVFGILFATVVFMWNLISMLFKHYLLNRGLRRNWQRPAQKYRYGLYNGRS
jgi:hypothetical protein